MILQIDGWYGAGKSVLNGLLDGHMEIASNPLHDATHMAFLMNDIKEIYASKDIEALRRLLGKTQYYILEKSALLGESSISFGAGIECKTDFNFDFYAFDKLWVTELLQDDDWRPESIITHIYKKYSYLLNDREDYKYFATMSWPLIDLQTNFFNAFPNSKSILVKRPIADIIAVRSGRTPRDHNGKDDFFAPGFDKLIKNGEIQKIVSYYKMFDKLCEKHPNSFFEVDFSDLIHNRRESMHRVSEFLEVNFSESMLQWTFLGKEVKHEGCSYVDKVNDSASNLLSKKQIDEIKKVQLHGQFSYKPSTLIRKVGSLMKVISNKLEEQNL